MMGHTVEKCYKIHGYPPGYRSRRPPTTNQVMNNASSVNNDGSVPNAVNPYGNAPNVVNPFPMSQEQCQQLNSFLSTQLPNEASTSNHQATSVISQSSNFSGNYHTHSVFFI